MKKLSQPSAVAIGTFDGLHRGHQFLIRKLIAIAKKEGLRSVVVALERPVKPVPGLLTTPEEKIELISRFPVDEIVLLKVEPQIIGLTADRFFEEVLRGELQMRHLVVGKNFAFGHDRTGNVDWLTRRGRADGIGITIVKPLCRGGETVSSSRIRKLLGDGGLNAANELLGRCYHFYGKPEKGRGFGRQMGVPTVNLAVEAGKLLPPGVHAAVIERRGRMWPAIINIGTRPTFFAESPVVPEVFVLNFKGVWGTARTRVWLCRRLRDEQKFPDAAALARRIATDVAAAKRFFRMD